MIVLIALLVATGILGTYLAFGRKPATVTPPPAQTVNEPVVTQQPPITTPEVLPPADRDRARFRDIKQIQAGLELYHAEQNKYPLAPLPLNLGLDISRVLSAAGFSDRVQGSTYLDPVPRNPSPGGVDYRYESVDGATYAITFELEEGMAGLPAGSHQATPQGVDGVPPVTNPPVNTGPVVPRQVTPPQLSLDTDQDGLTDAEEKVFGTDLKKPDSDGDGFLDGAEVAGGYDPAKGSGAKLQDSAQLAAYDNARFGYGVRYPVAWLAKAVDEGESEVIFSSAEPEFVEVLVVDNPEDMSAAAWYAKQVPGLTAAEVPTEIIGGNTWAFSLDGLNAYLAAGPRLFTMSYNIGTKTQAAYYHVFRAILRTFQLTQDNTVAPGGAPANTNANTNTNTNANVSQ